MVTACGSENGECERGIEYAKLSGKKAGLMVKTRTKNHCKPDGNGLWGNVGSGVGGLRGR